ncbi:hypothetical protein AVEN_230966-1 [Araneus ventricosus]|uniref:Uncharacterized protein n=1 Tax=Araneus ventricosus TaxID=182803 RepID=A0A4Y2A2Q1_ARAVE|nr:hypothetical protein AVEN_230966-1 [Araneus ventricosus]
MGSGNERIIALITSGTCDNPYYGGTTCYWEWAHKSNTTIATPTRESRPRLLIRRLLILIYEVSPGRKRPRITVRQIFVIPSSEDDKRRSFSKCKRYFTRAGFAKFYGPQDSALSSPYGRIGSKLSGCFPNEFLIRYDGDKSGLYASCGWTRCIFC